nr:LacI family DNA-binding transcriptional regulator [Bifidobacterium miconisargentati]
MKDVGAAAGVSVYVASRALRGESGVAASTRARVVDAAARLGYVRNEMAAGLKMRSSHTVGILTASGRNQYYSMLAQAIDNTLHEYGYFAVTTDMIKDRTNAQESEEESVRLLLEQRPAAIIATYLLRPESLAIIDGMNVPVVFVDSPPESGNYPFVGSDNYQAGRIAGDYLGKRGHERATVLAFPRIWSTFNARTRGFEDAAEKHGMQVHVCETRDNDPESAFETFDGLLERSKPSEWPDAVFALNTMMVMGAFRSLKERGVKVGKDISLIAIDDFDWAPLLQPPLTVVAQNMEEIGRQAARFVIDAIKGNALNGQQLTIGVTLVERGSVADRTSPRKSRGG